MARGKVGRGGISGLPIFLFALVLSCGRAPEACISILRIFKFNLYIEEPAEETG